MARSIDPYRRDAVLDAAHSDGTNDQVASGLFHVRGPASRLAAAFRIDPATERHPLPAATTARAA